MESKTEEEVLQYKIDAYNNRGAGDFTMGNSIYRIRFADDERTFIHGAMQEFAAQQNKELVEKKQALWNKLNEFYEAFGCATDITPELLRSVQQTLNENGK